MNTILTLNIFVFSLLTIVVAFFFIQLYYYLGLYSRINRYHEACQNDEINFITEYPSVSIIICAQDESDNLRNNLPAILEQDYPEFEVIVINDGSTDESDDVLKILSAKYKNLYHTFTPDSSRYLSRKKLSMTLGIKASKHPWLVFTEANCVPESNQWLKLMARNFTQRTEVVLGYSNFSSTDNWLNRYATFDLFFTTVRFFSYALARKPYMGMGRNMAYRRELFFKQKGYSSHLDLLRGEDNLFINQVATPTNTRVEISADATMHIKPYERYKDWKEEKMNYFTTSRYYKGVQRFALGFETTSRLLLYLFSSIGIITSILSSYWIALGLFIVLPFIQIGTQSVVLQKTAKNMGEEFKFVKFLPLFNIAIPFQILKFKIGLSMLGKQEFRRR